MSATHLELLVEEASMEAFLGALLPRLLPEGRTFAVHPFQGKADLLSKLHDRLCGYASWLPKEWRIVVVVDRDNDDCRRLKRRLESAASAAGLRTRSRAKANRWQLANRIAIEELEAWYFGDWAAVCNAYPRVSANIPDRAAFRDPDAIRGGTWEAFERVLRRHGYHHAGLPKLEVARTIGARIDRARSRSNSFRLFHDAVVEALS